MLIHKSYIKNTTIVRVNYSPYYCYSITIVLNSNVADIVDSPSLNDTFVNKSNTVFLKRKGKRMDGKDTDEAR